MPQLDRDKTIALAVLFVLLLACIAAPALALKTRSDAAQELSDEQDMLARLIAARQRAGAKTNTGGESGAAPDSAFLNAQTPGLASALLETHLTQLVMDQHANLVSSGVQQAASGDTPEVVRVQATLDIRYNALQELLYQLETGTPYVFVDSMAMQPPNSQRDTHGEMMKVTLNLRSLWHKTAP